MPPTPKMITYEPAIISMYNSLYTEKDATARKEREDFNLKVLVECKISTILILLLFFAGRLDLLLCAGHDASLLVVADTLFEEIGLSSQGDVLHKVKGIGGIVKLAVAKSNEKTISTELDVLAHQLRVHSEKSTWQGITQELLLNGDGLGNDCLDSLLARAVVEMREQETSKVCMHALVSGDELIGEGQAWHQTSLLEPED
jgi:hypothetical protein